MAISYVGGVVAGRTGNSNATIDVSLSSGLTGGSNTGVSAGDLVVVTVCTASQGRSSTVAVSSPATYQNLTAQRTTATTYDTNVQVSYKFMPSTPDSVVTIPAQGDVADGQAYVVQVFRGVDPTTPLDVTPTYATGSGTNNNPDPAQITPTTAGAWIVVTGGGASATGTTLFTTATLTNFLSQNGADTNDGTVGAGYYTAWTSGAYNPAAFGGGNANAANSWGATTIALRPAPEAQTLSPSLYSNGQTFYDASITRGTIGLSAALYSNSNTFYAAEITQTTLTQTLTATLYENTNSFYTASAGIGAVTLTSDLYSNANTFYQPTVNRGAVTLSASLYSNINEFYTASASVGSLTLTATRLDNSNTFYTHAASVGSVALIPSLYSNSQTFYAPSASVGSVTLTADLYTNTNTFYPANAGGVSPSQDLTATLYSNTNTFYASTVQAGTVTAQASLFTNTSAFYAPSITVGGVTLSLEILVNSNEFYAATVQSSSPQELQASLYSNSQVFYAASVMHVLSGQYPLANMNIDYPLDDAEIDYPLKGENRVYPIQGMRPDFPLQAMQPTRPNRGRR